nr:MAG TPA: Regulatory peptide helical complex, MEMBRANE PROTEIN [Caudoviricetes sp.]
MNKSPDKTIGGWTTEVAYRMKLVPNAFSS